MKKVALVFLIAVLAPSLVLAWLAVRSLRDQQFLIERQQSLLCQGIADEVARNVQDALAEQQRLFTSKVTRLLQGRNPVEAARSFDESLRKDWPLAEVGFVVTLAGDILSPPVERPEARKFLAGNSLFLANRESAEVYLNPKQMPQNLQNVQLAQQQAFVPAETDGKPRYNPSKSQIRNVVPQQKIQAPQPPPATFAERKATIIDCPVLSS